MGSIGGYPVANGYRYNGLEIHTNIRACTFFFPPIAGLIANRFFSGVSLT